MTTTIFNEHCKCCDAPIRVEYHGIKFVKAECSCVGLIWQRRPRDEEHAEFVRRIVAAKDARIAELEAELNDLAVLEAL